MKLRRLSETIEAHTSKEKEYEFEGKLVEFYRVTISDNNQQIGGVLLMVSPHYPGVGMVSDTEIVPSLRNRGYGHELYLRLIAIAKNMGLSQLWSDTQRKPAIDSIWRRLGAELTNVEHGEVYRLAI